MRDRDARECVAQRLFVWFPKWLAFRVAGSIDYGPKTGLARLTVMASLHSSDSTTRESAEDARAGSTPGVVRYVLMASLVLVIVAFLLIFGLPNMLGGQ